MNIAYVMASFPVASERFVQREIAALQRRGVEVVVFALRRPPTSVAAEEGSPPVTPCYRSDLRLRDWLGACAHFALRSPGTFSRLAAETMFGGPSRFSERLRRWRNFPVAAAFARRAQAMRVDHVHAHFAYMPADVARVMGRLLGVPHSVSVHARDLYTQPPAELAARLRGAAFVAVCTQQGLAHALNALPGFPHGRVQLVRHGVVPSAAGPGDPREPLVLAVARLEPKKGLEDLIAACGLIRRGGLPFRCVIAGAGSQRDRIAARIESEGLSDTVTLAGWVASDRLSRFYRQASVIAMPSIVADDGDRDGIPNALIEAMSMETPVVATRVGGIPELVDDGVNGFLVEPRDPAALAERLAQLLRAPDMVARMGKAARQKVGAAFDIGRNIDTLLRLFRKAGEERGATRGKPERTS